MTDRTVNGRRATAHRFGLCAGLAAVLLIGPCAAGQARADDHDRRGEWHRDRGEHGEWRERHYQQPYVYYAPPPVIYPPPGYYQEPLATLNFGFPFYYR